MSMKQMQVSDETLTAYLDGMLEPEVQAEVEATIAADVDIAARLDALRLPIGRLQAAMTPGMLDAPSLPPELLVTAQEPPRRRYWVPTAIAASFAIGFVVSGVLQPPAPKTGWLTSVAAYQALYITETLSGPAQTDARRAEVLDTATGVFDLDLEPATQLDGADFKRAQMLGFKGKPLLQMAYLTPDGVPMALCLIPVDGPDKPPEPSVLFDLAGISWVENGVGYYLVGGDSPDQIDTLFTQIRAAI
jgi:hypothetical protein